MPHTEYAAGEVAKLIGVARLRKEGKADESLNLCTINYGMGRKQLAPVVSGK